MKKTITLITASLLSLAVLAGCSSQKSAPEASGETNFDQSKEISVVSREDGSGTRGAFIELLGIEVKGDDGTKTDMTTKEAVIANKTDVMMTNIAGNKYGLGYISLGSLNETIKAISVDGAAPTVENVENGSYPIVRSFNIATKGEISELAQDFISFILSSEGQEIVASGYIPVDASAPEFSGSLPAGKIVVAGSSSVTPIMEKLKEAYQAINPDAVIEVQQSDSSAGLKDAIEGICDIGMASRDLKESEAAELDALTIALDGIAVIVNLENPVDNLSSDQIRSVFVGETTKWSDLVS